MSHTLELKFQIWNDSTGEAITVGSNPDGLDMIEIRYVDETGKIRDRITLDEIAVPLMIEALQRIQAEGASKTCS